VSLFTVAFPGMEMLICLSSTLVTVNSLPLIVLNVSTPSSMLEKNSVMLRMYLMQIWFNLSDEGIEDSIYDSYAMRTFMHIDFNEQQVPDATTLLKFRHMLEKNKIGEKIFADVNKRLDNSGLIMHGGTIVDASLIAAPKSTKNKILKPQN